MDEFFWLVECEVCGFRCKNTEIKKRWDGRLVCEKDWEPRHIGDFYRYQSHERPLPYVRDRQIKYRCYVTRSADSSPTTGAWTLLPLNTEIADASSEFTTGTSTYRPAVTASREFRFGVAILNVSGECSLNVALYKNGSPLKVLNTIYSHGPGVVRLSGMHIDSTATSTTDYTVRYFITGSTATIKALDSGTYLEVK